jgi:acid phosphatase (class A)
MNRLFTSPLILAAAIALATGSTSALAEQGTYLNSDQIDLTQVLAPPPALNSAMQKADLARVLEVQRMRTPEQVADAKADTNKSVFRFADVLGPSFNEADLPKTAALFDAAGKDAAMIAEGGKLFFKRARPFVTSSEVHPTVPINPKAYYSSYPSEHATYGYMTAILLAQMVPEKRAQIFSRGRTFGLNRIVDGVHYPSDVEAGRIDGTLIAATLMQNPKFEQDFAAAKAEVRAKLGFN